MRRYRRRGVKPTYLHTHRQWYRSEGEAVWQTYFDIIGQEAGYETYQGDGYLPDFKLEQGYGPELSMEMKPDFDTRSLSRFENKSYCGMAYSGLNSVLVGGLPFIRVTDDRCCDNTDAIVMVNNRRMFVREIAAIYDPNRGGCGSMIWWQFPGPDGRVLLGPHCRDDYWPEELEPALRHYVMEFWKEARRVVRAQPPPPSQPSLFDVGPAGALDIDERGEGHGLVSS